MSQKIKIFIIILVPILSIYSCKETAEKMDAKSLYYGNDPMPSFEDGDLKVRIFRYVNSVCDSSNIDYVKPEDRIACFDNDGTLWAEQPLPNQIYFTFDRIKQLAEHDEKLITTQPFKAVIENDTNSLKKLTTKDIVELVAMANSTENVETFDTIVNNWFKQAEHPVLHRKFDKVIYQPMLELLNFLREKDFKIFIVSGGSVEFMRPFAPRLYDIPTERVIGSRLKLTTKRNHDKEDSIYVERLPEFSFNDDKEGKVQSIEEFIGKKPIMVVGNSDGDLAMMEYASMQKNKTLMIYIKHTDGDREFDYSKGVLAGALKEGEKVAEKNGWIIVDMKRDWKKIFN
ncbi:MAG TPA: HAD family hydrolase [Saprospiraceae bacterium]|nr:HAD family hydrolase [Saprospiraceae bacterium]